MILELVTIYASIAFGVNPVYSLIMMYVSIGIILSNIYPA